MTSSHFYTAFVWLIAVVLQLALVRFYLASVRSVMAMPHSFLNPSGDLSVTGQNPDLQDSARAPPVADKAPETG